MVRKAAVAGGFYPAEPVKIRKEIQKYLDQVPDLKIKPENLRGIICPHAGYIYSGPVAAYSYKLLTALPETKYNIFLLGPAHYIYTTASVGNFEYFETPLGKIKVNQQICEELLLNREIEFDPKAHQPEHSLEVQLPFLQFTLKNFEIIPILLGNTSPQQLSQILNPYFNKKDSLFVISSDLSHYQPYDLAKKIDKNTIRIITSLNLKSETQIDACGHLGIKTMMYLAKQNHAKIELLNYRNSGDTAGDKSAVVGYASMSISSQ